MASRYDGLDSRTELEQRITEDLKRALIKRGFEVDHQGTSSSNAAGDRPDIIIQNGSLRINVEVTQTVKSSSDREFLSIKDHLEKAKEGNATKKCFVIYGSPETHYRMINAIRDYNIAHKDDRDMKMLPLAFSSLQLLIDKLIENPAEIYPKKDIIALFDDYKLFVDDSRILEVLRDKLFPNDDALSKQIEQQEEERHGKTVEYLVRDLLKLENQLRDERGITHIDAIKTIIFLVFIKLYEEKREFEKNEESRFKKNTFVLFQSNVSDHTKAIHKLFDIIKNDEDLKTAKVFTATDIFLEKLDDEFALKFFIEPFEKYHFYTTRIDGIGAAYEVLGRETGRDKAAGQFFTPENVVKFMMRLADLEVDDIVLDPACGTSRFLIYSMEDMKKKAEKGRNAERKKEQIAKDQLFGTDYDPNVAKLAKMNMYIHGDGKSNIFDEDGLTLYDRRNLSSRTNMDGKIDVILTNPPLGEQSYQKTNFDDYFKLERMLVIPKRNLTQEALDAGRKRLEELQLELTKVSQSQELAKSKRISKSITRLTSKISSLQNDIQAGRIKWKATGNGMKGGALFLGACRHYLKSIRNANEPIEWRGGRLLIILDEGILNTSDYQDVRNFIRRYFFVKAIISLSRETFVPISGTSTKTSILYAIKKDDSDVVQKEPIFFAHAEKVGLDTRSRVCPNHLFDSGNDILSKFFDFKQKVYNSYVSSVFSKERFQRQGFTSGSIEDRDHTREMTASPEISQ